MIKIENNGNTTIQGTAKDILCEIGCVWSIFQDNPKLWRGITLVVIPALMSDPQVITPKQKEYLQKLLVLNLEYTDIFDAEKEVGNESN